MLASGLGSIGPIGRPVTPRVVDATISSRPVFLFMTDEARCDLCWRVSKSCGGPSDFMALPESKERQRSPRIARAYPIGLPLAMALNAPGSTGKARGGVSVQTKGPPC